MSLILLKHSKLVKYTSFSPFQLIFTNKFSLRSKQIDPRLPPPGKYDINRVKPFKYSYEDIPDNLRQSGRMTYKPTLVNRYKTMIMKKEYQDFKQQEIEEANKKLNLDADNITEEDAHKAFIYVTDYVKNRKGPPTKEKIPFSLDEIRKTVIPEKERIISSFEQFLPKEEEKIEIKDDSEVFEDALWGNEKPIERKYDRILLKELFWISRNDRYYKESDRRINYLKEFVTPYVIHDAEIVETIKQIKSKTPEKFLNETSPEFQIETQVYKNDKEIPLLFEQLKTKIMKTHYKQLPNIALSIAFDIRYKKDQFKLWTLLEKEIFQNLHHYDLLEIAKIRYAMAGVMPKIGSPAFAKACIDMIKQEIKQANIYDILYIYTAYKNLTKDKLHSILYKELIERKSEVLSLMKQDPDIIANILYTYANSRIKKFNRRLVREKDEHIKEAIKLIDLYLEELMKNFDNISLESVSRLALAFTVLRLDNYLDVLFKIQTKLLANLDKLDYFLVASFLYSFSKFNNGKSSGDLKFYNQMTELVEKFWPEFSNKDKSRIFYSYTTRGYNQERLPLIEKLFIPWAKENVATLSHSELAPTIISLMFLRYTDKDFWKGMIKNISKQKYVVPLTHYFAFQIAKYYVSIYYPKWNLKTFEQALYEAGSQFNAARVPKPTENEEFLDFFRVFMFKLHLNNKPFLEWDNLFTVDIALLPQKVGILKQSVDENFPESYEIRPFYNLKKFILDNKGWKVWVINWKEYLDQGESKDDWLMKNFNNLYLEQSARYAKQKSQDGTKDIFEKYNDFYEEWSSRMDREPLLRIEMEGGTGRFVKAKVDEEQIDSRVFTKFGKQGTVKKAPVAAGGTPAAPAGGAAPPKPPAGK